MIWLNKLLRDIDTFYSAAINTIGLSKFDYSTSWTTNILTARRFIDEYPSSTPFVVTMIVEPKDILVNVEMLPDRYYHTNQREIILLPGKYSYKIIWEGKIE